MRWVISVLLLLIIIILGWLHLSGYYELKPVAMKQASLQKPGYPDKQITMDENEIKEFAKSMRWSKKLPITPPTKIPEYTLKSELLRMKIWRTARIGVDNNGVVFSLPESACRCLDLIIARLELQVNDHFGELIEWNEVKNLFPMYAEAEIIDFETRMHFRVQRRAGSSHADVQPLTKEDTKIMKTIFQGRWSWERRAAIVVVGSHRIAASMNGKPHGAGAIKGNNFPGHFCLHFLGSKTHASGKVDNDHQKMVLKAGGKN
ncbi:MAG: hypothetical protein ACM3PP_11440 [Candidatus Saccharibacteria bacterium]